MTPSELRKLLDRTLTTDSLRVLCHQLKVDYDNLEGGSKQARLVSLLTNLERHGRLYELQTLIENDQLPVITGKLSTLVFPLYNLPSANPHFTGREDLLMELTQNGERIAITQTITGLGGVGKTQLALAYANQQRANFDLIWWLNGSETALLDNGLQQLGQVLGLPLPTTNSIASRQMVLTWLGSCDKQWLLIYDNVDQLQPRKLRTFLPNGQEGCQLLITSRNRHWQGLVTRVVEVTTFAPAEAKRFLTARLGETDKMLLADLAEELGYLPLALEQAVAYMVTGSVSISDYLRLFKTRRQDLWAMERPPDMYHETVATTWAISFEKIQEVRGVPELIALCSILAQDAIPIELLINASAETITLQRTPLQDEIILQEAIYTLNCYSLVHGYANNLAIHPLVQTVYRDRLGIKSVKQWINTAIALLRPYFPDWTLVHKWANGLRLLPHMLAVADLAANIHLENKRTTFLDNWIGFYFKHSGDYQRARPYYERALSATENLFGKDHLNTADILTNLGMLLQAMGLLTEAQIYRKRALEITEVKLGLNHPTTALSLNNYGGILKVRGEYEAAHPYYERSLAIYQQVYGFDHYMTASVLNNIGGNFMSMGKYSTARSYIEHALSISKKIKGFNHPFTATGFHNLAILASHEQNFTAAEHLMQQAVSIREQCFRNNHPDTEAARAMLSEIRAKLTVQKD